jgi:MFS family permease
MAGLGFVVGMVGGGVITELFGWRWIFLLNVPIVLIMLLPVQLVLPEIAIPAVQDQLMVAGRLQ